MKILTLVKDTPAGRNWPPQEYVDEDGILWRGCRDEFLQRLEKGEDFFLCRCGSDVFRVKSADYETTAICANCGFTSVVHSG